MSRNPNIQPFPDRGNATVRSGGSLIGAVLFAVLLSNAAFAAAPAAPATLAETGLYSDFPHRIVAAENLAYSPQYPLWTDGAAKDRWIHVPAGTSIDAGDPDAWDFPVGTKLWKQFSFGRPVETRYMERVAGGDWIFATYVWNESGTEATLAPAAGVPRAVAIDANTAHDIPGYYDCLACHHSRPNRVLGFNLLQLSKDRDPLAANAVAPDSTAHDLPRLIAASLVRGLPDSMRNAAPRIPAATATERAALGYLYGNCAGCHNRVGPLAYLDMSFDVPSRAMAWNLSTSASASSTDRGSHDVSADGESPIDPEGPVYEMPALATTVDRPTRVGGSHATVRIRPGDPQDSAVVERAGSRNPALQMPPLGTHRVDAAGMALLEQWIREMPTPSGPDTSMREVDLENAIPAAQLASSSEK